MEGVYAKQQSLLHLIDRALENFKRIGKNNYTPTKIRSRISTLTDTWAQCIQGNAALMQAIPEANRLSHEYFNQNQYDRANDVFQNTIDYMKECLEELQPTDTALPPRVAGSSAPFALAQLPPIKIPSFSGKLTDWESFRDRFTALIINNKELPDVARMHFLTSSLSGSALDSIKHITVIEGNFQIAWKSLVDRYENKRRLIDIHVAALSNLPQASRESASELSVLYDRVNDALAALANLQRTPEQILNDVLVYNVSRKLDNATRKAWILQWGDATTIPTYKDLQGFIASRIRALQAFAPSDGDNADPKTHSRKFSGATVASAQCFLCRSAHPIAKCPQFIKKSPSQRLALAKQANRCVNCLSEHHLTTNCTSKYNCRVCHKRHHSMLHLDTMSSALDNTVNRETSQATSTELTSFALSSTVARSTRGSVLLATARVLVGSSAGYPIVARALLDQGSELTFISERLVQALNLRRFRLPIAISAIGSIDVGACRHAVNIRLSALNGAEPVLTTTASVLKSLTSYACPKGPDPMSLEYLKDITFADPNPTDSEPIDLIIGADLYGDVIRDGIRKGTAGQPFAQNTMFGWVLSGPISSPRDHRSITVQHCSGSLNLDDELRRFWEVEEVPRQTWLTLEEQQCEQHFVDTHSRAPDGRYIVRLPFKKGPPIELGHSRRTAERLLKGLHQRFNNNPDLKTEYVQFMKEYEALGHMQPVPASEPPSSQAFYIPHHPVIKETSATTRLRVVFNASSPSSNATSLNDHLFAGQKFQTNLAAVIFRWRQYRYVYGADIAKMYRQILVDPRDVTYQRILWSTRSDETPQEFQLVTVTYGIAAAPFLALRVLRQLLQDKGHPFPLAVPVLQYNIYVDDVLFGADDMSSLRQIRNQVNSLLNKGGFNLRKWSSNSAELLSDISSENHGLACHKALQTDAHLKILGISWHPATDVFHFQVVIPEQTSKTKRAILSMIARFYDPLGWSTPVTVNAKIFLQGLWLSKLGWDDPLPSHLVAQWEVIRSSLSDLDGLQLSRWTNQRPEMTHCELHGFADASTRAYAAAVYLKVTTRSGEIATSLLVGKSKVAPVKQLSVPRLELCAAVLLTRLMVFTQESLHYVTAPCYCWTDSTVVLAWLAKHPSRWQTFVANRVAEIQTQLPSAIWRHVPTHDNPADCASRGLLGGQLPTFSLWWRGPTWLSHDQSKWPDPAIPLETSMERKPRASAHVVTEPESWTLPTRFSLWPKLVRVTAYINRFVSRSRCPPKMRAAHLPQSLALTAEECNNARIFWIKYVQAEVFPVERKALLDNQPLSRKSVLFPLHPFIDDDHIIRVGGRLANAPKTYRHKHPIVLSSHHIVKLIVHHAHIRSLHAGVQLTLSTLRQEYWILRSRNIVRYIIHQCVTCTREKAVTATERMGDLPAVHVTQPSRAFLHCGIDYAGPVLVRPIFGRGIASRKAYVALFVCMATRAVHLELVEGYSTPAFMAAYSRFCARRGLPESMYSDNGTTFTGADRELTLAFRAALRDPAFQNRTACDRTIWHFIPPSAPHFGGLWEAGVKSVKHHLRRIVGSHTLTFEEFTTLLCKVEGCLNSRPLAPLTDTLDSCEALTPGHFLIGSALTAIPEPSILTLNENRLSRWQLVRQMSERFWKLWKTDYLNTLQQRSRWRHRSKNPLQVGKMVLIQNQLLPLCKWKLGRITQCHPGSDGLVRVVTVKTATSEYKRPITKLCLLPIDSEHNP